MFRRRAPLKVGKNIIDGLSFSLYPTHALICESDLRQAETVPILCPNHCGLRHSTRPHGREKTFDLACYYVIGVDGCLIGTTQNPVGFASFMVSHPHPGANRQSLAIQDGDGGSSDGKSRLREACRGAGAVPFAQIIHLTDTTSSSAGTTTKPTATAAIS